MFGKGLKNKESLLQDSQHLAIFVTGRHDVMPGDDTFGIFWSCGSGDERASSANFSQCTYLGVYSNNLQYMVILMRNY